MGLVLLKSASHREEIATEKYHYKQSLWIGLGLIFLVLVIKTHYLTIEKIGWGIYLFSLFFLVVVLGVSGEGVKRWLNLGPFYFQPTEVAKLGVIFILAQLLKEKFIQIEKIEELKSLFLPVGIVLIPAFLTALQPDLGSAVVFPVIFLGMVFWTKIRVRDFILIFIFPFISLFLGLVWAVNSWVGVILIGYGWFLFWRFKQLALSKKDQLYLWAINLLLVVLAPLGWQFLKDYQKERLLNFLHPQQDPFGTGYNVIQSKIALGSGELLGKGYLQGTQTQLSFLPAHHTDFIFSVLGEEWGLVGVGIVLLLYLVVIGESLKIAFNSKDWFGRLVIVGIVTLWSFHLVINIGMTIGVAPVTGLPLPWLSYGGTFMMTNLMMVGLILNIGLKRYLV